jgi:hypothetical protein
VLGVPGPSDLPSTALAFERASALPGGRIRRRGIWGDFLEKQRTRVVAGKPVRLVVPAAYRNADKRTVLARRTARPDGTAARWPPAIRHAGRRITPAYGPGSPPGPQPTRGSLVLLATLWTLMTNTVTGPCAIAPDGCLHRSWRRHRRQGRRALAAGLIPVERVVWELRRDRRWQSL